MANGTGTPLREKVEPGIWKRRNARGQWVYEISWKDAQGKQRGPRKVDGGLRAARAALAEALAARGRGERVANDPRLKFEQAAEAWLNARSHGFRPNTDQTYRGHLKHHLIPAFGKRRLTDIDAADIASYIAAKKRAGYKGWTIKGHLTVLSGVFKYAIRHLGHIGSNPVSLLDRVERPKVDDERPKRILALDELLRLLDAIPAKYRLLFRLAAETGGRISEVLGLIWSDIAFDAETISISYQLNREGQRVPLKSGRSRRCIEITPGLVSDLRRHKLAAPADRSADHDLVFITNRGVGHDHRNIRDVLERAAKRAGLDAIERDGQLIAPSPSFHDLRHTHASALIASGWDIEQVSARLGHASVAVTMAEYVHEYDKARRNAALRDKLAALYDSPASAENR
jgi:integrase